MEAVAAHALVVIGARQGERVGRRTDGCGGRRCRSRRPAASPGKACDRRLDAGDVVRLVQRRERDEPAQLRDRRVVDQHRLDEIRARRGRRDGRPRRCRSRSRRRSSHSRMTPHRRVMVELAAGRRRRTRSSRRSPASTEPFGSRRCPRPGPRRGGSRTPLSAPKAANFSDDEPALKVRTICAQGSAPGSRGHSAALATGGLSPKARPSRR